MSLERKLIGALTDANEVSRIFDMGVTGKVFEEPLAARVFGFIITYWRESQMQKAPTVFAIEHSNPGFHVEVEVEEDAGYLAEQLMKRFATNNVQRMVQAAAVSCHEYPIETLQKMMAESYNAAEAIMPRHSRSDMSQNVEDRRRRYAEREQGIGTGVTLGLPELDEHAGNLLPGELAAIGAFSKVGKCVGAGTLVFTGGGLTRIGDLGGQGPDQFIDYRSSISTRDGVGRTKSLYHRGAGVGLSTCSRYSLPLVSTGEHRLLVPTAKGLEWRMAKDVHVGDQLLVDTSCDSVRDFMGDPRLPRGYTLTPSVAGLLGWAVSEGSVNRDQLVITKHDGTEYGDVGCRDIVERAVDVFGVSPYRQSGKGWRFTTEQTRWMVDVAGLHDVTAAFKEVPGCILRAPTPLVLEFLRCYFEGDSDYSRGISICSASRLLMEQVSLLLLHHVGVVSEIMSKEVRLESWDTPRTYWTLKIPAGDNGRRFARAVAPLSEYVAKRLARWTRPGRTLTKSAYVGRVDHSKEWAAVVIRHLRNVVPDEQRHYVPASADNRRRAYQNLFRSPIHSATVAMSSAGTGLSMPQIAELVAALLPYLPQIGHLSQWQALRECAEKGYFGSEVVGQEECVDDFWDFSVEGTHSYVANGVMSHNTMMLAKAASAARLKGYTPIIFSLEMPVTEIEDRMDAMFAGVSYNRMSKRSLSIPEMRTLFESQDRIAELGPVRVESPDEGERTVSHLISRARHTGCDYVLIDQLSFMEETQRYPSEKQRQGSILKQLKNEIGHAHRGKMPCLLAVQLRRESLERKEGPELNDFADAAEVERTCDLLLALSRNKEQRMSRQMLLQVLGGRRCEIAAWILRWDLVDFTDIHVLNSVVGGRPQAVPPA